MQRVGTRESISGSLRHFTLGISLYSKILLIEIERARTEYPVLVRPRPPTSSRTRDKVTIN
jgi:hypothetical protein